VVLNTAGSAQSAQVGANTCGLGVTVSAGTMIGADRVGTGRMGDAAGVEPPHEELSRIIKTVVASKDTVGFFTAYFSMIIGLAVYLPSYLIFIHNRMTYVQNYIRNREGAI
jgi:hypothetical protein